MDPSKDIYHKEIIPFLARRKKRHSLHMKERTESSSTSTGTQPGGGTGPPPTAFRPRRSSPRGNKKESNASSLALWWGLGIVVAIYFVALAVSFFIRATPKPAEQPKPVARAVEEPPRVKLEERSHAERDLNDISSSVRTWTKASKLLTEAVKLRQNGQLDRAADKLTQALEGNPSLADAQVELAEIWIEQNKYDEAVSLLRKALESRPDLLRARHALATALASQRNFAASLAVASWMIEADPYAMDARRLAAMACINIDQPGLAIDHLKRIIAVDRRDLVAQNMLAQAHTKLGQLDKALAVLQDVQSLDASNSMSYYNLAVCYAHLNKAQQALDVLARAAGMFGSAFVDGWTRSSDFDLIRSNESFVSFQKDIAAAIAPESTNAAAESPAAATGGVSVATGT
ncbi:MAG: tetratricopeptide repeat protein [bacterium]